MWLYIVGQTKGEAIAWRLKWIISASVFKTPNWLLVGEYVERSSTAETEQREQLSRLLEGCHAGQINFVITQSVKWFGYNTTETLDILRELQTLGVDVYFENEELHSLGPDGKLRTNALMAYMF